MAIKKIWLYGIGPFLYDDSKDAPLKIEGYGVGEVLVSDSNGEFDKKVNNLTNLVNSTISNSPTDLDTIYADSGGWTSGSLSMAGITTEAFVTAAIATHAALGNAHHAETHNIGTHGDVVLGTINDGDILQGSGGNFIDKTLASAGIADTTHAAAHQNGGADEINVGGLSGALADAHTPAAHTHTHVSTTGQTVNDHHDDAHILGSHSDTAASMTSPSEGERIEWISGIWEAQI